LPPLFHKAGRLFLIAAVLLSSGAHWVVLQSVAWTAMLVENSREAPLVAAVKATFDGSRPCTLCQKIDAGRQQEKEQEAPSVVAKIELFYEPSEITLRPPRVAREIEVPSAQALARTRGPLLQPPRGC
jgi:hypothetical protein